MMEKTYKLIAILFGILASVLAVLAVVTYLSYIPASWVDNFTDAELGTFSALSVVGAIAFAELEKRS